MGIYVNEEREAERECKEDNVTIAILIWGNTGTLSYWERKEWRGRGMLGMHRNEKMENRTLM